MVESSAFKIYTVGSEQILHLSYVHCGFKDCQSLTRKSMNWYMHACTFIQVIFLYSEFLKKA